MFLIIIVVNIKLRYEVSEILMLHVSSKLASAGSRLPHLLLAGPPADATHDHHVCLRSLRRGLLAEGGYGGSGTAEQYVVFFDDWPLRLSHVEALLGRVGAAVVPVDGGEDVRVGLGAWLSGVAQVVGSNGVETAGAEVVDVAGPV